MRKSMIMRHFLRKHSYTGLGFIRKDLYNLCCREKRKLIANGDSATALGIMAAKKKSDPAKNLRSFDHSYTTSLQK